MGCQCAKSTNQEKANEIVTAKKPNSASKGSSNDTQSQILHSEIGFSRNNKEQHTSEQHIIKTKKKIILNQQLKSEEGRCSPAKGKKSNNAPNPNYNQILNEIDIDNKGINSFVAEFIFHLNNIRANPGGFAEVIEGGLSHIETNNNRVIYHDEVKVKLSRGQEAFLETSCILKQLKPMKPIILNLAICVKPPKSQEEIEDKNYLLKQIELLKKSNSIDSYWSYQVGIPKIALMLLIVSDTKTSSAKKRNDLLNPSYQSIGISSIQIGKHFISYFTFN